MDIVWFAEIKWDYLRTRKQQLIRRKPDDVRLLFLEPFVRGRPNRYDLRMEDGVHVATVPFIKAIPESPLRSLVDRPWVRGLIDRVVARRARRLIGGAGFDPARVGFVLSNVFAVRAACRLSRRFLLYDCNDAHAAFPGMPAWTSDYYRQSCLASDAVVATSIALAQDVASIRGGSSDVSEIGNGVGYARFDSVYASHPDPEPPRTPTFGYVGAIAPWFDFDAVERLARARSDWSVVLVGPVMGGAQEDLARLTGLPNVVHRPPVPHEDVPALLQEFTVGLIPFRYNELTRGVNPNKMYEYLAMGLPVVATRFSSEVERFPDLVKAVDPGEGFVDSCREFVEWMAGDRRRSLREAARSVAAKHDWSSIAEAFWRRVRELENQGG